MATCYTAFAAMRFLPLLSLLALTACDSYSGSGGDIVGSYILVSGAEAVGATVDFANGGDFGAQPVCNSVFGTYSTSDARVDIDVTGTTFVHCGDGMSAEVAFNDALESSEQYSVVDDQLTLFGPDGELVFERRTP